MYHLYYSIFTTTRSAMSKLVEPEEVGKIFSIIGFLESTMQLVAKPIFSLIYHATLHILLYLWILTTSGFLTLTQSSLCNPCGDGQGEESSTRVRDNQDECNRECLLIIVQCKHNKYIKLKVLGPSGH